MKKTSQKSLHKVDTMSVRAVALVNRITRHANRSGEGLDGFGFRTVGGNGFDKARDGKCVADAARFANKMEFAVFAAERNRDAHQGGDARTVNLWNTVKNDD